VVASAQIRRQSEDCLYLNIFTPAADVRRRAVLIWLHGGRFVAGSASSPVYDGGQLAELGDVVVVTAQYRLGVLGHLFAPSLAPPNLGLLDQLAVLHWVRAHIADFGGDPSQVTLAGDSAGGTAVLTLMAMSGAQGLFRRAVLQSFAGHALLSPEEANGVTYALLTELGLRDPATLRSLPLPALLEAQQTVAHRVAMAWGVPFGPVIDGTLLTVHPLAAIRDGAGVPDLLLGSNVAENDGFRLSDPRLRRLDPTGLLAAVAGVLKRTGSQHAEALIDAYRRARTARRERVDAPSIFDAILTDYTFRIPAIRLAEAHDVPGRNAHAYLFEGCAPRGRRGGRHGAELPFVFGAIDLPGVQTTSDSGVAAHTLCTAMMSAWLAFVRGEPPMLDAVRRWPRYDRTHRATACLGREVDILVAPLDPERRAWDSIG
jgi:para-nitrobenzyl esterase